MPRHATETLVPPSQRRGGDRTDEPGRSPDLSGAASAPPGTSRDMTDHWGPLEGWTRERELLACYLTFSGQPGLHSLIEAYQRSIKDLEGLDPVSSTWLHSTIQGIAFADTLDPGSANDLAAALAPRLAGVPALRLRTRDAVLGAEGPYLRVGPGDELQALRGLIQETACSALGLAQLYALPGQTTCFDPHVTLAYANSTVSAAQTLDRLGAVSHEPVEVELTAVSMVRLRRDDVGRRWHWSSVRPLPLARR